MSLKTAVTDFPVHTLVSERWSPYAFADRPVSGADLRSLFEAARWAPSASNQQPWVYLAAARDDAEGYQRILSCLVEFNQSWAKAAPVLALGAAHRTLANGSPNRWASHDLGLASGSLLAEATSRGIAVHQMGGVLPDKAREVFSIPDDYEVFTGLAIGYAGDPAMLPEGLQDRERARRSRNPLREFVFDGKWGEPALFLDERIA